MYTLTERGWDELRRALGFAAQPLALLVLALGLVWSIWLGTVLLREPARDRVGHRAGRSDRFP